MSSEVKIRNADFMESQSENESLRARIREVEDENQELRAQNLLQNRTVLELRNELMMLRIQMSELAETSALLRERVRILVQNSNSRQQQQQQQQENEGTSGPITAPPLMAPPPVPPPLPPARIRISPRQVGAGEAVTTPLGVSLSSPPRHRIKRDCRQGIYKSTRIPYRRFDGSEPGPSSQTPFYSPDRPNYFVGLKIIPQFQSFVCPTVQAGYSDSASDSSGSDENPQLPKKTRPTDADSGPKNTTTFTRDFDIVRNVRNLPHQKVRQTILQNYNLSLPNNGKFFFPFHWDRKNRENPTLPSTSGNEVRFFQAQNPGTSERSSGVPRNALKVSDCVQYTFPTIHEGLHHSGISSVVASGGPPSRLRKFKKNIPYLPPGGPPDDSDKCKEDAEQGNSPKESDLSSAEVNCQVDSESFCMDERSRLAACPLSELPSDLEQDGFQADESSNCLTSADNSLEKISISESNMKKN